MQVNRPFLSLYMIPLVVSIHKKMKLNLGSWLKQMSFYVSVTGVAASRYLSDIFSFWSRWPIVVAMNLSKYLVMYDDVNIRHDLKNFFLTDLSHVYGKGLNVATCKNLSYSPLEVGVHVSKHWCSIGGRRSHLHSPVMLLRHTIKYSSLHTSHT